MIARATLSKSASRESLTSVPPRTQYEYERKAEVINKANYASYGRINDNPELAIALYGQPGHYSKAGEIRQRLPNGRIVRVASECEWLRATSHECTTYESCASHIARMHVSGETGEEKGVRLANKGRLKKINQALDQVDGSLESTPSYCEWLPATSHVCKLQEQFARRNFRTPISGEIGDLQPIYPLYSSNPRQTKRVMRKLKKLDDDPRSRPGFIYQHAFDYAGKGGVCCYCFVVSPI